MVILYKKWKRYNEIQLTKNKMDLNIRKMTNHPPSVVERSKAGTKNLSPKGLNYSSGLSSPLGRYAPKQWMNFQTNLNI